MTDETTSEQLAEIEGQATGYTPPEGWRVVQFGEQLLPGDVWVNQDGTEQRSNILQWDASAVSGGWCIRRIKPEPQPEPQPEPEPVQVPEPQAADTPATEYTPPEGWRVLAVGEVLRNGDMTVRKDGYCYSTERVGYFVGANQRYIRPIESQPLPQPEPQAEQQIEELRSEVAYVQNLLGESRQRVTQLQELVGSLRTINEAQEKAFTAAGQENTALRNQLAAVKAELASVAADRQQLRVELDAAQQVPVDSPELRQLRADLEQVTQDRDTYRHAHELLLNDVNATHARTKAMTVEAIAEWLEPIRLVDSAYLANATMQHLPQIMRHLTGLDSHAID